MTTPASLVNTSARSVRPTHGVLRRCRLFSISGAALAGLGLAAGAVAAPPDFAFRTLSPQPAHVAVADLDGDGCNDLVLHSPDDDVGITWQSYAGGETFRITSHRISGDRVSLADVDGDGDLDVLSGTVVEENGQKVYHVVWYENPRPARDIRSVREWTEHPIGVIGGYLKDVVAADFNGDGRIDVVARTHQSTRLYVQPANRDAAPWFYREFTHEPHEGMEVADLDRDGRPDIVLNGFWFQTPADVEHGEFKRHEIDRFWYGPKTQDSAIAIADFDGDGLLDVAYCSTEKDHMPVAIYFAHSRADVLSDHWERQEVQADFGWCQTFAAGDYDLDGHPDLLIGKFERQRAGKPENEPPFPVLLMRNADGRGRHWEPHELSRDGMYAGVLADWGGDGDLDVVGQRTYWGGPVKVFENLASDRRSTLDRWTPLTIDDTRTRHPLYRNGGGGWFGIAAGHITRPDVSDIVCGQWLYRNPGGDLTGKWERSVIAAGADSMLVVDVDGDGRDDVIALKPNEQLWCKPLDADATQWDVRVIGHLPLANHGTSSQGTALGQLVPGGKPEIIITGPTITYFEIPDDPTKTPWPATTIVPSGSNGEAVVAVDVDGDGLQDIVAAYVPEGVDQRRDGAGIAWWRNPGPAGGEWKRHVIGKTIHSADRIVAADLNGDGRPDIAVTEERYPGYEPDAHFFWFEAPADPTQGNWTRHLLATQFSMNNLDAADLDGDGDVDLVVSEHRGMYFRTQIWENDGRGHFMPREIDRGHEMHLGARLFDLNGDGKPEIIGTGWSAFEQLHVLRNDNVNHALVPPDAAAATVMAHVTVSEDAPLYDAVAETNVDFTALMRARHLRGAFDPRSLIVHELDAAGKPLPEPVPHQFEYTKTGGVLMVYLAGATPRPEVKRTAAALTRTFAITFGSVPRAYDVQRLVTAIDNSDDGFELSFKVVTPNSFFFIEKKSHGVSALIDRDRSNWIGYNPGKGSSGEFRGLPNVTPVEFHPGKPTGKKELKLVSAGPLKLVFEGATLDDKWKSRWEVYPAFTRLTLTTPGDTPYWLLYEGTPAGKFQPEKQYVLLSDGQKLPLTERWQRDLPGPEWAAFGDPAKHRVLFVAHPDDDDLVEQYWPMEGNMTVFGFGRGTADVNGKKRSVPLLTAVKNTMAFGIIDTDVPAEVARRVKSNLNTARLEIETK